MKTILITGAGTGIGAATARQLASNGYAVVLVGRRADKLEEVKATLSGEGHVCLTADVSDKKGLHQAIHGGALEGHDLCAVYANAGIGGSNEYGDDDRWEQMIDINLSGAYYTIMECLPLLKKSKTPFRNIVVTSSCLARFGVPNYTAYCASKSGLMGLVRALAVEHAEDNILVNAILPGWVDTEMARGGIELLADVLEQDYDKTHKEQMSFVPLQKMSEPQEVAALVDFLCDERQRSITGQCLDINNGSFMN